MRRRVGGALGGFGLLVMAAGCAAAEGVLPAAREPAAYVQAPLRPPVADRGAGYLGPVFVAVRGIAGGQPFVERIERFVPPVTPGTRRGLAGALGAFPEAELLLPARQGPLALRLELAELEGPEVLLLRMVVTNPSAETVRITRITLLGIDPAHGGVWASGLQQESAVLLCGAPDLLPGGQHRLSPATASSRAGWYQLIYEHSTGRSALAGMLTSDRALSEILYEPDPSGRGIAALQVDLLLRPFLELAPGAVFKTDILYIDRSRLDPFGKLQRFFRSIAAHGRILPPAEKVAAGWDPWRGLRGESDAAGFTARLDAMAELFGRYGLTRCLIGPGWADRPGAWIPGASVAPDDIAALAARVRERGLEPGIWWTPFVASRDAPIVAAHPEWLLPLDALGRSLPGAAGAVVLDPSNTEALEWVLGEADRLAASGAAWLAQEGIEAALFGERYAVQGRTAVELVRDALERLRDGRGPSVTALAEGSGAFLGGRASCVRTGTPLATQWSAAMPAPPATSAELPDRVEGDVLEAIGNLARWLVAGNVLWQNHAGTFVLENLTPGQAQAALTALAMSGASFDIGDSPEGIDAERADALRKTLPPVAGAANVLDLLDHDPPWIWHRSVRSAIGDWELVALFHWGVTGDGRSADAQPRSIAVPLPLIGLPVGPEFSYHAYEFWSGEYLGLITDRVEAAVPPASVRLIKVARALARPELLASSRHWTMGAVDVTKITWNSDSGVLFGRQELIAGLPLRLTFVLPAGWEMRRFHLNGVDKRWIERGAAIEVELTPASDGSQFWELVAAMP